MGPRRTVTSGRSRQLGRLLPLLLTTGAFTGCGSGSSSTTASTAAALATTPASASCAKTVAGTLGTVAARIYHEAATGGDVAQAVHRMQTSTALAAAVNAGNEVAAQSALRELLLGQIVRVEVLRGGRVFAQTGTGAAIAPVRGPIPGTNATFVLSTQSDRGYLEVVHQVTGAQVLLTTGSAIGAPSSAGGALSSAGSAPSSAGGALSSAGSAHSSTGGVPSAAGGVSGSAGGVTGTAEGAARRIDGTIAGPSPTSLPAAGSVAYAGRRYQTTRLTGAVYPSGELHIVLLVPSTAIACPGSSAQARVETLGYVGERIYREELHSPDVAATVRHIESSTAFQNAVAAHDAAGARAAIVEFFRQHIHVVRVRVSTGAGLLVDVGGPYVLAPVRGTVRSNGQVVGQFEMAIQDDAGYLKLAHLFTGAEVLMRSGERQVRGTLSPGPATVPDRGSVSYAGRTYQAYSFTGVAFPSGPLRISLLLAS